MKRKIILYTILTLLFNLAFSQQQIIPPSPNAASLGKFGDIPVGYYTGIPNISIPIYTIKSGSITLPITLDYHASGIKLAQEASWVGLGWALNAGGVISRTVCGYDDFGIPFSGGDDGSESPAGYYYEQDFPYLDNSGYYLNPVGHDALEDSYVYYTGDLDGEADIYCFNFNGHSGKFYFNKRGLSNSNYVVPICSAKNDLDIKFYPADEYVPSQGGDQYTPATGRWEIVDGKGFKYFFETKETTTAYCVPERNNIEISNPKSKQPEVVSSWYLDRIESPSGDIVSFVYDTEYRNVKSAVNYSENILKRLSANYPGDRIEQNTLSRTVSHDIYLSKINFNNGSIELHTSNRSDLLNSKKLDSLVVRNNQSKLLSCSLYYNYFNDWQQGEITRLKLNSLQFYDSSKHRNNPYIFGYNENNGMPAKNSNAVDHWGFYNGKGNSHKWGSTELSNYGTLIPSTTVNEYGKDVVLIGADREPDFYLMQTFVLNSIMYPTGGKTDFLYEPNTYSNFEPYLVNNYRTKAAGIFSTNPLDDKYDTFTITESQDVDIEYGFIDNQITNFQAGYENDWGCYFVSGLEGSYAQIYKIESDGTSSLIKEFHATAGEEHAEDLNVIVDENSWQFSKSEKIHLQSGNYKIQIIYLQPDNGAYCHISAKYIESTTTVNTKSGGGLRIKKITNTIGNNIISKTYDYKNENNLSSGKLMSLPVYSSSVTLYMPIIDGGTTVSGGGDPHYTFQYFDFQVGSSQSIFPISYSASGSIIGYDKVTETIGENGSGGKNIYYYNNNVDILNTYGQIFYGGNLMIRGQENFLEGSDLKGLLPYIPTICNLNNGLLQKVESFNQDNTIVNNSEYKYSKSDSFDWRIKSVKTNKYPSCLFASVKFYDRKCEWWKLDEIKTTRYLNGKEVCNTKTYEYNDINLLPKKETDQDSNGKTYEKQTTYPCDINDNGVYSNMKTNNMIEYPIESREYINGKLIKGQLTTYNSSLLPYENYLVETTSPLSYFNIFNGTKSSSYSTNPQFKFNYYGSKGNINNIVQKDGTSISYLWSYNNEYPIAEIKNATYTEVRTALSGITPEQLADSGIPDMQKVEALRQNQDLLKAMITTYTYKPLIGILTATDPRGVTTYYDYDSFNRLKETYIIENGEKKILQKYDYHYANQQ